MSGKRRYQLTVTTTTGEDVYPVGSDWEYDLLDGRLNVLTGDGAKTVYPPGAWLRSRMSPA